MTSNATPIVGMRHPNRLAVRPWPSSCSTFEPKSASAASAAPSKRKEPQQRGRERVPLPEREIKAEQSGGDRHGQKAAAVDPCDMRQKQREQAIGPDQ